MKKIFTYNKDIAKTAYVNWRTDQNDHIWNMIAMADGFLSSAIELSKVCIDDNHDKKADMLIFPTLTNANHGIELYLKSMVWILNILLGADQKIEGKHNIQQIYQTLQAKLKTYKGQKFLNDFKDQNKDLEDYIGELFSLLEASRGKDNMDFSRYPINKDYESHFYVDMRDNVVVDLENFVERFQKIKDGLEAAASYLFHIELRHEY